MLIPVILGVTFLVYFILGLTPGDPATLITGGEADEATVEAVREELGLNDPVVVQYARYMWDLLHGDMGESWSTKRDVFKSVMDVMPNTLKLGWWSMVFCIVTSLPIGIISATKQYSIMDNVCMVLALLGLATPNFWLGLRLGTFRRYVWLEQLNPSCIYPGYQRYGAAYPYDPFFHAGGCPSGLH